MDSEIYVGLSVAHPHHVLNRAQVGVIGSHVRSREHNSVLMAIAAASN